MDELFRRSQLLARLLKATTSEPSGYVDPATAAMELEWEASSLLAAFLSQADVVHRDLDHEHAASLVTEGMLAQLEDRGMVRWILGRMQIAPGGHTAAFRRREGRTDGEPSPLPPEETDALAVLVEQWNAREREPVAIERNMAESIRATHAAAHPATPALDALVEQGWFETAGTHLVVCRPEPFIGRAAARLWVETLRRTSTRAAAFDEWLAKAGRPGMDRAAPLLPPDARSALLDEMLARVLAESDLGDPTHEWAMAILARDDLGTSSGGPPPLEDASDPLAVMEWWSQLEKRVGESSWHEMRADVSAMVACIVRHEPLNGAPADHARRVRKLLEAGRERIFLLRAVQLAIRFGREETIAALLLSPEHVRLALALLAEVDLEDDAFIGWTDEQQRRHEQRVQAVWYEATSVALEVLLKLPLEEAAREIAAILVPLADDATRSSFFSDDHRAHADAQVRLRVALALLQDVELGYRTNKKRPRALPKIADGLALAIRSSRGAGPGKLRLLFWLFDQGGAAAAPATALVLHDWISSALSADWFQVALGVASYPWDRVARDLDPATFDTLIATTIDVNGAENKFAAMDRERLFLRVLVRAHSGLATRAFPTPEQARRRDALEATLMAHLQASASKQKFATDNPFSRLMEGTGIGANVDELTAVMARALDLFSPAHREQTIRAWLGATDDAILLTRAGFAMRSTTGRAFVLDRLANLDLAAAFRHETAAAVAGMAEDAIGLRDRKLVEQILAIGDAGFTGKLESSWREESLKPRLALAALQGDQATFDALLGGAAEGHEFQRALLALHADRANEAVALFERLVEENPRSPAAQVNLFAARIQAAQALEASEKEQRLEHAIERWHAARAELRREDLEHIESIAAYNMLLALDELQQPSKFDDLLHALSDPVRLSPGILRLAVEELKQRGEVDKAATLLKEAEAFHGTVPWLEFLKAELKAGSAPARPEVQVAAVDRPLSARELRAHVHEALSRRPEEIAVIFGEPDDTVETLLRRIHVEIAEEMLLLEATLGFVRNEDKYNQIFAKILKGRIERLGWTIAESSPGGISDGAGPIKGTAGGEGWRDWIIQARGCELCVGEALRCQDKVDAGYVTLHVNKLAKYDPVGHPFALVIAYIELADFEAAVERYRSCVETGTYPELPLAHIDSKATGKVGLKTFQSIHTRDGSNVTVHHILIRAKRNTAAAASK